MGAFKDVGDLVAIVGMATFLAVVYALIIILQFILENWIAIVLIISLCGFGYYLYKKQEQEKQVIDQDKSLSRG